MTTTVYDRDNKVIAADTRWSVVMTVDSKHYLVYTDDSVFEKIADRNNASMVMAGNGKLIADWKQWWFESLDPNSMPDFEVDGKAAIVLLIIDKTKNSWIFDIGEKIASICSETKEINAVFSGSGSASAANCWSENRCAKTAVVSASVKDVCTGEKVRYVDFEADETNIESKSYDYEDIVTSLIHGGYIMEMPENQAVPLKEHPLAAEVSEALASGQAVACAPTPALKDFVWDAKRKEELKQAIYEVRELEGLD